MRIDKDRRADVAGCEGWLAAGRLRVSEHAEIGRRDDRQMTPSAIIASATFLKAAMFAPRT